MSPVFHIFKTIIGIVNMFTSRKRLKQFLTTPLYTNAFYLMLNTAVMSLLGFFFWIVVARFYTEVEVGYSSAIISTLRLLASLSLIGLDISLIRFLPQAERVQDLINTCLTLSGAISLVTAGTFIVGLDWWSPGLVFIKQNAIFTSTCIAFTLVYTLSNLMDSAFLAGRRAGFILSKNTISSLLKLPLPILFVFFFHTFGIIASYSVALGTALAISLFLFLPRVQRFYKPLFTIKLSLIKDMWQYSSSNYVASLLSAITILLLPVMVVNLLGAEQNAYFYIAWMIVSLLFAIPDAVSQSLFAEGSHFEDKLKQNVVSSFKFALLLLIPAAILLVLLGKWLLLAFGQSYSASGLHLLQILAISSLPFGINSIYSTILRVTDRIKELIMIRGIIAIVVILTSYLIVPKIGIIGIGYTWLGAQTLVAIYVTSIPKLGLHKRDNKE